MFGVEEHAALPHIEGWELETAEYISKNTKPVIKMADVIKLATTNGRGVFHNPTRGFGSERLSGIEDSLALNTALGLMEVFDRKNEGTLDASFRNEVFQQVDIAKVTPHNVDDPYKSVFTMPVSWVIELASTDTRGYIPVPRVRLNGHEDSLALSERLGWMTITRAVVLYRSTAQDWSILNLSARLQPSNVDTLPKGEKTPMLIVSPDGVGGLTRIVDGNINAHLGPIEGGPTNFPVTWSGSFARKHIKEIVASAGGSLPVALFNANHRLIVNSPEPA